MTNSSQRVETLLRTAIAGGEFRDIQDAEEAVRAWLQQRQGSAGTVAASLQGDMTEEGDAEYQDQAMRSVDA